MVGNSHLQGCVLACFCRSAMVFDDCAVWLSREFGLSKTTADAAAEGGQMAGFLKFAHDGRPSPGLCEKSGFHAPVRALPYRHDASSRLKAGLRPR
jgi:hypothetical protein